MPFGINIFGHKESSNATGGKFERFRKYGKLELDRMARKNLSKADRHKFEDAIDGQIKRVGDRISADRLLRVVGSSQSYEYKQKIKKQLLTEHDNSEELRKTEHNRQVAKLEHLRAENPSGDSLHPNDYHSATPDKLEHRNTFYQPGSSTPTDAESDNNNHASISNRAA
jgi:hypothetical protein